jgi:hypothetical protein
MALLLFLVMAMTGCASRQEFIQPEPDPVNLSGSWELDYELSENANDKLRFLYEVTRSQLHQQQAVQRDIAKGGRVPYLPASSAVINSLQGVINLGRLTEMISRSSVLNIEQTEDDIVVAREGDFSLTCDYFADHKPASVLGKETCGWQGNQLVFEVTLPEGLKVNHRLVLSGNGKRLNLATTVSSSQINQLFTLNRVYMPFEPGKGLYECEYTLARKKTCRLGSSE